MNAPSTDLRSLNIAELELLMHSLNEPGYRAGQIFEWLHKKKVNAIDEMSNLPAKLRAALAETHSVHGAEILEKHPSQTGDACKYLLRLKNDTIIESVLMRLKHGNTLCVSTQAGCRMGCAFCASTVGGLERNLTAGEICGQVYAAERDSNSRVDSIVLMGCGEPLDNFDNAVRFIELITHPLGADVGARHITLSTCGLVPEMYRLAELNLPITLAVSLHAPNDEIRKQLMPVAKKYGVREVIEACRAYAETTHRRITLEYILAGGVNDGDGHASELCKLLRGLLCHVNLLALNAASGDFKPSGRAAAFKKILERRGIPVTVRRSLGGDVQAACGQLRSRYKKVQRVER